VALVLDARPQPRQARAPGASVTANPFGPTSGPRALPSSELGCPERLAHSEPIARRTIHTTRTSLSPKPTLQVFVKEMPNIRGGGPRYFAHLIFSLASRMRPRDHADSRDHHLGSDAEGHPAPLSLSSLGPVPKPCRRLAPRRIGIGALHGAPAHPDRAWARELVSFTATQRGQGDRAEPDQNWPVEPTNGITASTARSGL